MASYICTTSWRGEIKLPWQAIEHRGTLQTSNLISSTGTSWFLLHQSVLVNLLSILWANQHDSLLFLIRLPIPALNGSHCSPKDG